MERLEGFGNADESLVDLFDDGVAGRTLIGEAGGDGGRVRATGRIERAAGVDERLNLTLAMNGPGLDGGALPSTVVEVIALVLKITQLPSGTGASPAPCPGSRYVGVQVGSCVSVLVFGFQITRMPWVAPARYM